MNLLIDIGNTAIKFGVYRNNKIEVFLINNTKDVIESKNPLDFDLPANIIDDIERVFISSVVPEINIKFQNYFEKINKEVNFISPLDESGVKINIDYKEELGTDLLCDLAGANDLFKAPILIVDLGTATKFLFIDKNGVFSTCAIVPGLELTLQTLNKNTSLLPKIELGDIKPLLENHNTKDVLMASAYYSHIDMINGMVNRYKKEVGYPFKIVMSGGNAKLIIDKLDFDYETIEFLCLYGIKIIADRK